MTKNAKKVMISPRIPNVKNSITEIICHHDAFTISEIGVDAEGMSHVISV